MSINTHSDTRSLLQSVLFLLLFSIAYGCSTSSAPEDGILPADYNWAYGWWRVTEDNGEDYERTYDLIINGSTLQSNEGYIRFRFGDEGLYPVYTMPEITFAIEDDEDTQSYFDLKANELCLYFTGIGGYDEYLILNKTKKTVARDAICTKVNDKIDPALKEQYEKDLAAILIEGDWKNTRKGSDVVRIQHSPTDILTKKGNIITYEGHLLSYDSEKDQLSITYAGIEEGEATFSYKRYDKKAELYEKGNPLVAGNEYTAEIGDYGDDPYRLTFSFEKDGRGRRTYYCMTPYGGAVADKGTFYWEYLGEQHFLVAYHDETSDNDVVKVLAIKLGNFEQMFNSSIYLEDNTRNKYYLDFDRAGGRKRYLDRLYDKEASQDLLFQSFVESNSFKQLGEDETTYSYSFRNNGKCDRHSSTRVMDGLYRLGNDEFKWIIDDNKVVVSDSDGNQVEVFTVYSGEVDLEIEDSHGNLCTSDPSLFGNSLFFSSSQAEKYGEPYTPSLTSSQLASIQDEVSGLQEQSKEDMLIGKSFSHMSDGLSPNTNFLHEYAFAENNVCIMSFYEINAVGNYRIRERSPLRWEIVGNKVRIYDPSIPSASKYDDFKIGYNCIIDQTGKIYD